MKRLAHQSVAAAKVAGVEPVYDYAVGQHVRTVDGSGVVVEISPGRVGDETYVVRLDNNLGGGDYTVRQILGLADERTAAVTSSIPVEASFPVEAITDHLASIDYPELAEILQERLPNERVASLRRTAAGGPDECEWCEARLYPHQHSPRQCERSTTCDGCGQRSSQDDMTTTPGGDKILCPTCWDSGKHHTAAGRWSMGEPDDSLPMGNFDPHADHIDDDHMGVPFVQKHLIDGPSDVHTLAPEHVQDAMRYRFENNGTTVYHPSKPGHWLHHIENFWDGPTEVKDNGDGTYTHRNPYNGQEDTFGSAGQQHSEHMDREWKAENERANTCYEPHPEHNVPCLEPKDHEGDHHWESIYGDGGHSWPRTPKTAAGPNWYSFQAGQRVLADGNPGYILRLVNPGQQALGALQLYEVVLDYGRGSAVFSQAQLQHTANAYTAGWSERPYTEDDRHKDFQWGYDHGMVGDFNNHSIFTRDGRSSDRPDEQNYLQGHAAGVAEAERREQERQANGQHRCPDCYGTGRYGQHRDCSACHGTGALSHEQATATDTLYHVTDNPHFAPDPHHVPEDNTFAIHQRTAPGLYAARGDGVSTWTGASHNYVRPYIAELHVPRIAHQPGRWGGERFIPAEHFDQVKVNRVIPLSAHEDEHWEGKPYTGPDARDMSPEERAGHKQHALDTLRERGFDDDDLHHLRQTWANRVRPDLPVPIEPPDACSYCGGTAFNGPQDTGRGVRVICDTCGGAMRSWGGQYEPEFPGSPNNHPSTAADPRAKVNTDVGTIYGPPRAIGVQPHRTASVGDPEFGFHIEASWRDVQAKAKRIRKEGGVRITAADTNGVLGEVRGDTATYESQVYYLPGTKKTAYWACGCKWGGYSWGRSPAYARFEGRPCSHVTALRLEAQSRGMFGRTVHMDHERMEGQYAHSPVTVQYQRPTERSDGGDLNRRTVPPGNMRSEWTPKSRVRTKSSSLQAITADAHVWDERFEVEAKHESPEHARKKRHHHHHTEDARKHAPNFGYGIGYGIHPIIWCPQCNGGGCGHCGGQGQVVGPGGSPTGGQGPGDMSTTTTATGDGSADSGVGGDSGMASAASLHTAMPWQVLHQDLSAEQARPTHVRDAGFKGFVSEHNGFHDEADAPDLLDDHLHHFIQEHGADTDLWRAHSPQPVDVDLTHGVWATQSHVGQHHIDRYVADPHDESWENQKFREAWGEEPQDDFLAHGHPMFVTHQGRLHAMEGHHRTAAAIQRGEPSIPGWHYDLDKAPVARDTWSDGLGDCEDCAYHHDKAQLHAEASVQHTAAESGFSQGNDFARRLDDTEENEPYIVPRKDEYARDYTAPGGQQYRLLHGVGMMGDTHITAHQRLSNGKYRGVGYLSWFGGKNDPAHERSNVNGGMIYKTHVSAPHRRRGLASAMLSFGLEKRPDLRHSTALSEDGAAFAAATPTPYEQGMQKNADWSVGDMLGSPGPQWQLYKAPTGTVDSANPGSTGWATSEDPPAWEKPLLEQGFGQTSMSSLHHVAMDQDSCPHDQGWNLHGQCKRCGHIPPTEADEPCDDPWCVANEPEHSKGEHIDPPHLDPGHADYHSAEHEIRRALDDHPDAWLMDHQHTGPSKYSSQAGWRETIAAMHHTATEPVVPTHAGVVLKAADTGRVLMIQRSNKDEADPARGTWEFPGGGIEEGDKSSLHGAVREFEEEVGQPFPEGGHLTHVWRSGPYVGHVVQVPSEDVLDFTNGRSTVNPDDPDGDDHEQSAWWDPEHARKNPALREECKSGPWGEIKKAAARYVEPSSLPGTCRACGLTHSEGLGEDGLCPRCFNTSRDAIGGWGANTTGKFPEWNLAEPGLRRSIPLGEGHGQLHPDDYFEDHEHWHTMSALIAEAAAQGELHDQPEGALPSTDGAAEDDQVEPEPFQPPTDGVVRPPLATAAPTPTVPQTVPWSAMGAPGPQDPNQGDLPGLQGLQDPQDPQGQEQLAAEASLRRVAAKDFSFQEQQEIINEGAGAGVLARNFASLDIAGTHYALLSDEPDDREWWLL